MWRLRLRCLPFSAHAARPRSRDTAPASACISPGGIGPQLEAAEQLIVELQLTEADESKQVESKTMAVRLDDRPCCPADELELAGHRSADIEHLLSGALVAHTA